jgi:hypothetical protein
MRGGESILQSDFAALPQKSGLMSRITDLLL